jgi:DNA-binding response OmpR family regulator
MRVLVVEDERGVADFIQRGLREAGYAVDVATEGHEALDFIELVDYDVIVLDIMLPGLDGISVLKRARSRRVLVPVILLTARDQVEDKVGGLDSGAHDYLTKPFAFPELLARIRALLRRPAQSSGTILRVQNVEMDVARRTVRVSGDALELSPREFSLLEFFLRHPDQVLTRTQIAQAVWENSFCTGTNVIDVYVGYLRRKIGRGRPSSFIRTVRGVGYRVGVEG